MNLWLSKKSPLAIALSLGILFFASGVTAEKNMCIEDGSLLLINGKILTLDARHSVVNWIKIAGDSIQALGTGQPTESECQWVVDLQGKTVIPGLIDSHIHFLRQGRLPGYDAREAESATDFNSLIKVLKARSQDAPEDAVITVLGGIVPQQFAEKRLPTNTELDRVTTAQVVYLQQGFAGPAQTNTAGIKFLKAKGVDVDNKGGIASGAATNAAYDAIKQGQTEVDRLRATRELMRHANSLGITMIFDEGGTAFPGASNFDNGKDFDTIQSLWKADDMTLRVRAQFGAFENKIPGGAIQNRMLNSWSGFGDDKLRNAAMGEHITPFPKGGKVSPAYPEAVELIAKAAWAHEQHSSSFAENEQHIVAIEAANTKYPITELRWTLSHVFELGTNQESQAHIARLKTLGMGVRVQNHAYTSATDTFPLGRTLAGTNSGPLYRTLLDAGLPMGAGTDGPLAFPMNPWLSIYYMVSGRDVTGTLVNEGETLTRMQALQLYSINNAKLSFEEDVLGSLEAGKLADLVILSADYLNVSDDELKNMRSVLTFVNGDIVYSDNSILVE